MTWRTSVGPFQVASALAVALLTLLVSPSSFGFEIGDRVEVKRGLEWARGTVIEFDATRNRYSVRLDDDGSLDSLTPEQREKRLTRNYFPSDMRAVRGADNPPQDVSPPATSSPSPAPSGEGGRGAFPKEMFESRTWSDKSGRFKVEATYGGMNGEKVILAKSDGMKIEVELAKLSPEDRIYAEAMSALEADNPFDAKPRRPRRRDQPAPPSGAPVDHKGLKAITPKKLTFKPESKLTEPAVIPELSINLSELPSRGSFGDRVKGFSVSLDGGRALVARETRSRGEKTVYVEEFDLKNGKSLGAAPLPQEREFLGMDANFGLVVWKTDTFSDTPNFLGAGRLEEGRLTPLGEFEPVFPGKKPGDSFGDFDDVWIVGPQNVMVGGTFSHSLIVWDVVARKGVWNIPVGNVRGRGNVSVSSDARYIALNADNGIAIVDMQAGTHVATLPSLANGESIWQMCFSEDNTRLVLQTWDEAVVCDLTTGKQLQAFRHETLSQSHPISFVGEFLCQQGKYIYDPYHRVLLWELRGDLEIGGSAISRGDMVVAVEPARFSDEGPGRLYSARMPVSEMRELAKSLGDPESLVAARAGDKVAINLEIDPAVASEDDIYRKLVVAAEKVGLEVMVGDTPLVLKAFCKQLPPQTIRVNTSSDLHFQHFPRTEDVVERSITPHPTFVSLSYEGTEVWRWGSSGQPGMTIYLNEGESLEQALQRITSPNLKLFENLSIELPLIKPGKATASGAYGASELGGPGASF